MKCTIYRSSFGDGHSYDPERMEKPCKHAVLVSEDAERIIPFFDAKTGAREDHIVQAKRYHWGIEINTLEDLSNLEKEVDYMLIVWTDSVYGPMIEIYDDWRE